MPYSKENYQNQWILTDDAFLQHSRLTSEDGMEWEFIQIDQVDPEKDLYAASHAHMVLQDYSEDEVNDMLHTYGYDNFFSYVMQFPDFYKQGILEMFFETEVAGQPVASCIAGVLESNSYIDVGEKEKLLSKILEVYSHLECSFDFKKPADIKKRLSDQIHAAEDKKRPAAETDNNSREKTDERSL